MKVFRRSAPFTVILLLALLLAACGGTTKTTGTTTTGTTMNNGTTTMNNGNMAATPTTAANGNMAPANNGGMMQQGITITPDMGGNMAALIHIGKAMINANQVSVLMTSKGFAIYTYKPDAAFTATCLAADNCNKDWPPVLAPMGMMTVTSSAALPKQLSVHQTPNGAQVFYDGHALYTYAADTQAGTAMGHGQDMQWYLADAMVTAMAANNGNMMQGITINLATMGNMGAFIHTGTAMINGNTVNILVNNKGFALYYYKPDTAFKATCTDADNCNKDWPPVLAPMGMMTVTSSVALPKQLSVHQTPNGAQVFYDGHALYTYATDTQPAVALGRGQDMQWYMVGFGL